MSAANTKEEGLCEVSRGMGHGGAEPIRHFWPGRPSLAIVLGLARLRLVASFSCRIFSQSLGCSGGFDSGVFPLQLELSQNLGIGVLWAGSFCAMAQDPS